jgi:hypothetical protein
VRIAREKGEVPGHLAWWVGWINTVPDKKLDSLVEYLRSPEGKQALGISLADAVEVAS